MALSLYEAGREIVPYVQQGLEVARTGTSWWTWWRDDVAEEIKDAVNYAGGTVYNTTRDYLRSRAAAKPIRTRKRQRTFGLHARAVRPSSRGYFIGRDESLKNFDQGFTAAFSDVTPQDLSFVSTPINQPVLGTGPEERIGREIRNMSLSLRVRIDFLAAKHIASNINLEDNPTSKSYRIVVFLDKQPVSTILGQTEVLYTDLFDRGFGTLDAISDQQNLSNADRFQFLYDKIYVLQRTASYVSNNAVPNVIQNEVVRYKDIRLKLGFTTLFGEVVAGQVITTNALHICVVMSHDLNNESTQDISRVHMWPRVFYFN